MDYILLLPSGLFAYSFVLWWRLRKIHRWEFQTESHLVVVERRAFCLKPFLRLSVDGIPQMAINYREVGLASQLLGGGFKFELQDSGQLREVDLWTDVDLLRVHLRCAATTDRGERQFLKPLIDGDLSRDV